MKLYQMSGKSGKGIIHIKGKGIPRQFQPRKMLEIHGKILSDVKEPAQQKFEKLQEKLQNITIKPKSKYINF